MTIRCSITRSVSRPVAFAGALALLLAALGPADDAGAYETDQFSNRLQPIEDSTALLNGRVNDALQEIARSWTGPRDDARFVDAVYWRLGGVHWVDKLERWAMNSDDVDRLATPRRDSIYAGIPIWATRFAAVFGVGPTIKVNGVLIGSDKLGHFFSQGRKFWKRFQRMEDEAAAAERSAFTERALFGQVTTGSYSNADLVANYEGHRFYRSLFEDDIVPGRPAILAWVAGSWTVQRPFDFADYVNPYWDEALNINHYDRLLYAHIRERLEDLCGDYEAQPDAWVMPERPDLEARYRHLQLRDTAELRLDQLCAAETDAAEALTGSE